ncbi:hypothetical protein B0H22_10290 [Methanohalophilus euhalobius]|jgi:hypothetical protein|uniref:Uncharacterized protein n=1 Tax=Methanohalophilus euhalobius TaxID=51203 RepID=A0A314ZTW3_9EURY|nr:hypothetical protein B0H22_10290 [Methanohalophilus euhalobius]
MKVLSSEAIVDGTVSVVENRGLQFWDEKIGQTVAIRIPW